MLVPQTELITIAAAGTPVQCTLTEPACAIYAYNPHATDKVYVGLAGLTKATGVKVIQEILAGAHFHPDLVGDGRNLINPRDYWFDAAGNGQTIEVTVWGHV